MQCTKELETSPTRLRRCLRLVMSTDGHPTTAEAAIFAGRFDDRPAVGDGMEPLQDFYDRRI